MTITLTWEALLNTPVLMSLSCLVTMLSSLWRPGLVPLVIAITGMASLLGHHTPSPPWILMFQTIILVGWVLYALMIASRHKQSSATDLSAPTWLLLMFSITGMIWSFYAQSFLTLFLCLECMSLPLYVTAGAQTGWPTAPEAALKYYILGSLSTAFLLFGISLVYGSTASLDLQDWLTFTLAQGSCCCDTPTLLWMGTLLILSSLLFKMAIVPFHMWTPDVYSGVPFALACFYSIFPKVTIAGLLMRFCTDMSPYIQDAIRPLLFGLGGLSILIGGFGALNPAHLGRLLGYSSILNSGFLLWGAALHHGSSAVAVFIIGYTLSLLGLNCMIKTWAYPQTRTDLEGLWHKNPYHATLLMLCLASWIGLPPLAGFWGKFQILNLLIQQDQTVWAVVGVIGSLLGGVYGLRLMTALWSVPISPYLQKIQPIFSWTGQGIMLTLALSIISLGIILPYILQIIS